MSGGGKTPDTQTQVSKPFPEQLPFVTRVFDEAQNIFNQGPQQFFPGQLVAGFSPETEAAFGLQTGLAGQLGGQVLGQQGVLNSLLQTPDPQNDPTVNAFADAATRPLVDQFEQQILPQIGSRAVQEGAFGGSRQAIQEAQAAEGLARAVGDTRAGIFNNAFGQQFDAQQRALALAPQINQQLGLPGQLLSQVGAARENLTQQQLDAERARFDFNQGSDLASLQNFSNLINQFGGGQTITSGLGGGSQRGGLGGALGGASAGASLAPLLGFGGPAGAAVGGLLGLF